MGQYLVKPSNAIIAFFTAGSFWVGLGHVAKITSRGDLLLTSFSSAVELQM